MNELQGKYLTFLLKNEEYAISITQIIEIIGNCIEFYAYGGLEEAELVLACIESLAQGIAIGFVLVYSFELALEQPSSRVEPLGHSAELHEEEVP